METIKRQIFVLRDTLKDVIDYNIGTDMVPIEYHVMDFAVPETAAAVVYVLKSNGELDKILADILDNVISFCPTKGFFTEGLNAIQIRVVDNNKALVSFTETVRARKNMKFDDDAEAQQKTLIEQLLTKIGESDGNMKIERAERIAGDENEKAERNKAIAAEQKEREKEIDVERQRINNLAKLQEGSTTGDAELADIRTGADGKIYENAGDAVRGQVTALKEELDKTSISDYFFNNYELSLVWEQGGLTTGTGTPFDSPYAIRTKTIFTYGTTELTISFNATEKFTEWKIFAYDAQGDFVKEIKGIENVNLKKYVLPYNAYSLRFTVAHWNGELNPEKGKWFTTVYLTAKDTVDTVKTIAVSGKKEVAGTFAVIEDGAECLIIGLSSAEASDMDTVYVGGKNLIYADAETQTVNGVTFTNNGDGTYTVNGTATEFCEFKICTAYTVGAGITYIVHGCPEGGNKDTYYLGLSGYGAEIGNGKVITPDKKFTNPVNIVVNKGVTVNNLTFKPMLEIGSNRSEFVKGKKIQKSEYKYVKNNPQILKMYENNTTVYFDSGVNFTLEYMPNINAYISELKELEIKVKENVNATTKNMENINLLNYTFSDKIPDYYVAHITNKEKKIRKLEDKCSFSGDSFVFITDPHFHSDALIKRDKSLTGYNTNNSIPLIRHIMRNTGVRQILFGGDLLNKSNGIDEMSASIHCFNDAFGVYKSELYSATGNHEYYTDLSNPDNGRPSLSQLYGGLIKPNEDKILGLGDMNSYCFDNKLQKIRYFIISCGRDAETTTEQTKWFLETLKNTPEGYNIIVMGHAFLKDNMTEFRGYHKNMIEGLDSLKAKTSYVFKDITCDYSGVNATVIGVFTGHTHIDGSLKSAGGTLCICTTCDSWYANHKLIDGNPVQISRKTGDIEEQAFDVVQIDCKNRKIYCTRIGSGSDREFTY